MSVWEYQRLIIRRLIQVSLLSFGMGAVMLAGRRFWRELGKQFIGFAFIELALAWLGVRISADRRAALAEPDAPDALRRETHDLRRLLEASIYVDLATMFVGRFLVRRGAGGSGWGVLLQAVALFLFDLFHAGNVPALPSLPRRKRTAAPRAAAKKSTG